MTLVEEVRAISRNAVQREMEKQAEQQRLLRQTWEIAEQEKAAQIISELPENIKKWADENHPVSDNDGSGPKKYKVFTLERGHYTGSTPTIVNLQGTAKILLRWAVDNNFQFEIFDGYDQDYTYYNLLICW